MPTNKKNLYLNEKPFIIEHQGNNLLNQRNELKMYWSVDTKTNLSFWTAKPDHCVESFRVRSLFLVRIFCCFWTEYGDLQSKSPYSLRMWRNAGQTNQKYESFSRSLRHNVVILIPLYCKFTVISWLNDCEDMKLVVPTHVVLFQ